MATIEVIEKDVITTVKKKRYVITMSERQFGQLEVLLGSVNFYPGSGGDELLALRRAIAGSGVHSPRPGSQASFRFNDVGEAVLDWFKTLED